MCLYKTFKSINASTVPDVFGKFVALFWRATLKDLSPMFVGALGKWCSKLNDSVISHCDRQNTQNRLTLFSWPFKCKRYLECRRRKMRQ